MAEEYEKFIMVRRRENESEKMVRKTHMLFLSEREWGY